MTSPSSGRGHHELRQTACAERSGTSNAYNQAFLSDTLVCAIRDRSTLPSFGMKRKRADFRFSRDPTRRGKDGEKNQKIVGPRPSRHSPNVSRKRGARCKRSRGIRARDCRGIIVSVPDVAEAIHGEIAKSMRVQWQKRCSGTWLPLPCPKAHGCDLGPVFVEPDVAAKLPEAFPQAGITKSELGWHIGAPTRTKRCTSEPEPEAPNQTASAYRYTRFARPTPRLTHSASGTLYHC